MIEGQVSLTFDSIAGEQLAQEGMDTALKAERAQMWRIAASDWLDSRPRGYEFTADDLIRIVGLPDEGVNRNNAVGAWMSAQSKAGRIIFTGRYRRSERMIRHGNLQRVWKISN